MQVKRILRIFLISCLIVVALYFCLFNENKIEKREEPIGAEIDLQPPSSVSEDIQYKEASKNQVPEDYQPNGTNQELVSAHFVQSDLTSVFWEYEINSKEDLQKIETLFATDDLMQLGNHDDRWPDGGTPVVFSLEYDDKEIEGCVYPQSCYRIKKDNNRSTLLLGETYYKYPEYRCEELVSFLLSKDVNIIS